MKILILNNQFSRRLFREAVKEAFPGAEITTISEFRDSGDIWLGEYTYSSRYDYDSRMGLDLIEDIISRDRVLCLMDHEKASRLVIRCANGIRSLLEDGRYGFILSSVIDRYTRDVLFHVAEEMHVKAISPLGSFISGYGWFTQRGERVALSRHVSTDEAERVFENLSKQTYIPQSETRNVKKSHRTIKVDYWRRQFVEQVLDPIRRIVNRDPDNVQYNIHTYGLQLPLSAFYERNLDNRFTHVNSLEIDDTCVYLPMHLIPEATTSYWCKNVAKTGYLQYLLGIIDASAPQARFLIKEHPAMYGKRELSFYDELASRDNVMLIHPLDRSNELLEKVKLVAVDTGTVGVEALLRGKVAICLEDSYYSGLHGNAVRSDSVTESVLRREPEETDGVLFIQRLLDGLFPSDFTNGKSQDACSAEELAYGLRLLDNVWGISDGVGGWF